MDKKGSWDYFDGVEQGDPRVWWVGGVLYIKESYLVKFRDRLG